MPVLVCHTFADKLYAEFMTEDGKHPLKESVRYEIAVEQSVSVSKVATCFPFAKGDVFLPLSFCAGNPR